MPTSQNRSNCVFRYGFLHLAADSTAQSGLKIKSDFKGHLEPLSGSKRHVDALLTGIIRTGNILVYFNGTGSNAVGSVNEIVLRSRIKIETKDC